jgi:hypothetical protein
MEPKILSVLSRNPFAGGWTESAVLGLVRWFPSCRTENCGVEVVPLGTLRVWDSIGPTDESIRLVGHGEGYELQTVFLRFLPQDL